MYNKRPFIYLANKKNKSSGGSVTEPIVNYKMNTFNTGGNINYRSQVFMFMYCRDMVDGNMWSLYHIDGNPIKTPKIPQSITEKATKFIYAVYLNPASSSGYYNSFNNKLKYCYFTSDYASPTTTIDFTHCYYLTSYYEDNVLRHKVYDIRLTSLVYTILITFERETKNATISGYTGNTPIKCYYHPRFKNASAADTCADAIENAIKNTIGVAGYLYLTEDVIAKDDWQYTIDEVEILNV